MTRVATVLALAVTLLAGCKTPRDTSGHGWPRYTLRAEQVTSLNLPHGEPFDASGLWLLENGDLLTQRNSVDSLLYRIDFLTGGKEANLVPYTDCFSKDKLRALFGDDKGIDCEGIARDPQKRFYLCEERRRRIIRCDPATGLLDQLTIDWSPVKDYFSTVEPNASFEGIAIGNGILYVANERSSALIIEVDLKTSKVVGNFVVQPRKSSFLGLHYSDLCWFEDHLWVLCRQHRVILKVEPKSRNVVAEYDYGDIESSLGYRTGLPVGLMEGLTVSKDSIWIVTDNNSDPRGRTGNDKRPTLVRCPRPE